MYGAIETSTEWVEGDERSRTNPGHGYPAHSRDVTRFHSFNTEDELLAWIAKRSKFDSPYKAIKYEPLEIETKIVIKAKPVIRQIDDRDRIVNR